MDEFMKMIQEMIGETEESEIETAYKLGVQAGIKMMENKIERQCELGKPILANDNLYWLKDAKQNLIDIMDDLETDSEYGGLWAET